MSIHQEGLVSIEYKDTPAGGLPPTKSPTSRTWRKALTFLVVSFGIGLLALVQPASAAPTVTRTKPSSGPVTGGQVIVISGTGFTGATAVSFGSVSAPSFAVVDDKQIVVTVPATTTAEKAVIKVTVGGETNPDGGTYEYKAPTIKTVSPGWAKTTAASIVTVNGTGFLGTVAADVVFTNGSADVAATAVWVVSDSQMVVQTPIAVAADSNGDGEIVVPSGNLDMVITRNTVPTVQDENSKFLFSAGIPVVTGLTDTSDSTVTGTGSSGVDPGESLKINGSRLWGASQVNFGSSKVKTDIVVAADGNSLTVPVPKKSAGPVEVAVINAAGESMTGLSTAFNFLSTSAPTLSAVYPSAVAKASGASVLLSGRGLTGVTTSNIAITCGSDSITATSAKSVTDASVIVALPTHTADSSCDITITSPADSEKTGTLTGAFSYL